MMSDQTDSRSRMAVCQGAAVHQVLTNAAEAMAKTLTEAFLPAIEKTHRAMKKLARALRGSKPRNRRKQKKLAKKVAQKIDAAVMTQVSFGFTKIPVKRSKR